MTHDDPIKLARTIGLLDNGIFCDETNFLERLVLFASLVSTIEREACAKIAEAYEPRCDICPSGVSTAIRARNE
jgi:hypothetical protein